ncbi:hypothetical protein CHGG_01359 [Chaetomium globosum CBS 148.51]|uniref:Uncharacterized protein n=1 Tax=Chaetomium globosum (strain ATCC 6205 / CBS 148.51 / DSM 1962 / NBRC 6347 / NRRL 1970) TaxID=306901 RepID=Q2HEJ5_CHAGB|nr:uncharacterized protein CHGG_01359 [Chaetomium globosum CBS 148.51]EAQ93124.1 hypothetical protein CHGG_01359 [Chaetomium globosum CBS 148.51]
MASPLSRPSICGLQAALSSCRISTTTTTTTKTLTNTTRTSPWRRPFSSTPRPSQMGPVPPESPRFITIPEPPQSSEPKLPPIKGHLPIPRDMFPKREGDRKIKRGYLRAVTRVSKAERAGLAPKSDEEARHRVLAAARRSALASGVHGLYERKVERQKRATERSERRRQANLAAATAPERLDDVLTRPTVRAATALVTRVEADPERFEKAEAARAQHQERMAVKAEARRDALAQLYVAAQRFIIDEAELEARIEAIFTADHHRIGGRDRGQSIWDLDSAPVSVADLQAAMSGLSSKAIEGHTSNAVKTTKRQKSVAEELTGGKL